VHAARDVRDPDDGGALLGQLGGRDAADVAEALDDAAQVGEAEAESLAGALDDHHDAGAGRLAAEEGPSDRHRLARDDLRHRIPLLDRVGVHHPGHRLLVRRHVRRRDVLLGPDERGQVGREPARDTPDLASRKLARVAADAALRTPVGKPEQRALPGHPHRERGALAEIHLGVVADAALRRAEHRGVLNAVGRERANGPVVELHGQGQDHRPLRVPQPLGHPLGDLRFRERLLELRPRLPVERRVPLERRHGVRDLDHVR
jgi:hypothetical protein